MGNVGLEAEALWDWYVSTTDPEEKSLILIELERLYRLLEPALV